MPKNTLQKLFSGKFLSEFVLAPDLLPFKSKEILKLDKDLAEYEQLFMNPDLEKHLISKNELLASFAISKAEQSTLTITEAEDVYKLVLNNANYDFISKKIKQNKKLTQKDHDKLEFFNIAKTFRKLNQNLFTINKLTLKFIKNIHLELTQGLDIFYKYLSDFTNYKSGKWRDNNKIRIGSYVPADYKEIQSSVNELIIWLKKNPTINSIAVFHTMRWLQNPFWCRIRV